MESKIIKVRIMEEKKIERRGGSRPGSGRQALGKVAVLFRLPAEVKEKVEEYARQNKITLSDAAERMIRAFHEIPLNW